MLPQLLGDKRHEGVQHLEQGLEEAQCLVVSGAVDGLGFAIDVGGLDHLEVPAGELIPEQAVDSHQCLGDAVLAEEVVDLLVGLLELGVEPLGGYAACLGLLAVGNGPSLNQTEGIPNLVVEVAALLAQALIEENVVASGGGEHHAHAHAIGAELLDKLDGVGRVAETLGHLSAQLVAYDTGEIDVLERYLAGVLLASHNHAGYPEEDNVWSGNQVAGGVVIIEFLVAWVVDAIKEGDGPQP